MSDMASPKISSQAKHCLELNVSLIEALKYTQIELKDGLSLSLGDKKVA